jgi:hypothetical protein
LAKLPKTVIIVLVIVLLVAVAASFFLISKIPPVQPTPSPSPTPQSKAELSVTRIIYSNCTDCYDIGIILNALRQAGATIVKDESVDFYSAQGQELVKKYGLQKVPAFIANASIANNSAVEEFLGQISVNASDGTKVLTLVPPPYFDVRIKKIWGRVSLNIIEDPSCKECYNYSNFVATMKQLGVRIAEEKHTNYNSTEGRGFVAEYNISRIPALLLSPDANAYPAIMDAWENLGTIESNGLFVLRMVPPPYLDVAAGTIKGLVQLIELNDSSCAQCYNVSVHKDILGRTGLYFVNETVFDVNSTRGKALVAKYNIALVPTVLLSPEANDYDSLKMFWDQVGTTEQDGWFVFRDMNALADSYYKNLSSGEVLKSNATQSGAQGEIIGAG